MSRHRCLGLAAKRPGFRHAFTPPYHGSARPTRLPAIRRGRQATCRSLASATECPSNTPPGLPAFRCPSAASCVSNEQLNPCGPTGRTFSGQGSLGSHRVDPHQDDRSPWWIYPNLTGPGTPCRSPVPSLVWKKQSSATLRYGSHFERTSLARRDSLGLPCRAAIRSLSRKKATNNRTRGTFRLGVGTAFAEPRSRRAVR